jgi:hypothetical protein
MLATVRGIFRQGRVELVEDPKMTDDVPVVVTFLQDQPPAINPPSGRIMKYGMLAVPGKPMSTEADFIEAEHEDSRSDLDGVLVS